MHHTGKKESKKEIRNKGKNNKVTKNLLQGDLNHVLYSKIEVTSKC